jgi:ppGpp synthetase/RelA/SpoT-type nucleotidyltranferase
MLTHDEIASFRTRYESQQDALAEASKYILGKCISYKSASPKVVRIVFSRDPVLKTWSSILKKIEDERKAGRVNHEYDDLRDVIALTALCPYESDIEEFIKWMKKAFTVHTPDKDALKQTALGHRARHYIVSVRSDEVRGLPTFRDIKCEIQVKTILEEAFDAKGHDLTYKPGDRESPKTSRGSLGF